MSRKKQAAVAIKRQGTRPALEEMQGRLRAQGRRITGQRALILQIILQSRAHLDAQELYQRARKNDPRLNLATVYRTLHMLKASGLVAHNYLRRDHRREQFESQPEVEHYHFTCIACGRVSEFESPLVEQLRMQVMEQLGVLVTQGTLCLEGYCPRCASQRK